MFVRETSSHVFMISIFVHLCVSLCWECPSCKTVCGKTNLFENGGLSLSSEPFVGVGGVFLAGKPCFARNIEVCFHISFTFDPFRLHYAVLSLEMHFLFFQLFAKRRAL